MYVAVEFPKKVNLDFRPHSSPDPSCGREILEAKRKILSPRKKIFALPSPHLSPTHCPNTWRAEPRKKNTLSFFKKKFTPAKPEMQGVFFLSGLLAYSLVRGAFSERTLLVRDTTSSARAISRDCFQNKFEFCTIDTAKKRNRILEPKLGRAEKATLMHSPAESRIQKGFPRSAWLLVCQYKIKNGNIGLHQL